MTFFVNPDDLTESEKIDAIYSMLAAQRRGRYIGIAIKILLVCLLVYGYHWINLPEHADTKKAFIAQAQNKLVEIVMPVISSVLDGVMQNMGLPSPTHSTTGNVVTTPTNTPGTVTQSGQTNGVQMPAITPEMIQAVQNSMKQWR